MRLRALALVLAIALTACGPSSKEDLVAKARDVKTRAELQRVLGKPDDVTKLGPLEKWTYRAKNGRWSSSSWGTRSPSRRPRPRRSRTRGGGGETRRRASPPPASQRWASRRRTAPRRNRRPRPSRNRGSTSGPGTRPRRDAGPRRRACVPAASDRSPYGAP